MENEGQPQANPQESESILSVGDVKTTETPTSTLTEGQVETTNTTPPVEKVVYDLKLSEETFLNQGDVERITSFSEKHGLSNEDAKGLLAEEEKRRNEFITAEQSKSFSEQEKLQDSWVDSLKTDSDFGGQNYDANIENARRVIQKYGSEELHTNLNESGLGNYPPLVMMMAKIGKAMGNDTMVSSNQSVIPKKKNIADIFYPAKPN